MSINNVHDPNWYADTGAMTHMITDLGNLASSTSYVHKDQIYTSDGARLEISHIGKTVLPSSPAQHALKNTLVIPQLKNLHQLVNLRNPRAPTYKI